ncbi:hypothetical protein MRX96_036607 [Rhipicephalus microplus]
MVKKDVKAWVIKTERELSMGYKNAKEVAFLLLLAVYFGDKQQGLLKVFEKPSFQTIVMSPVSRNNFFVKRPILPRQSV